MVRIGVLMSDGPQPKVRGLLLRGWADYVSAHFGDDAVGGICAAVPEIAQDVEPLEWYPATWQLAVTQYIVAQACRGDEDRAIASLIDYGMGTADAMALRAARWLGPERVFRLAPKIHRHLYNVGECDTQTRRGSATLRWSGAALFADPTWQLLQKAAVLGVLAAAGRRRDGLDAASQGDGCSLTIGWKR